MNILRTCLSRLLTLLLFFGALWFVLQAIYARP